MIMIMMMFITLVCYNWLLRYIMQVFILTKILKTVIKMMIIKTIQMIITPLIIIITVVLLFLHWSVSLPPLLSLVETG